MYISRIWGEKNPEWIEPKFCLVVDDRDVITGFKFGDDRLRGLGSAECQNLPFPIDFDGRPYNTFTLPCERVIDWMEKQGYIWDFRQQRIMIEDGEWLELKHEHDASGIREIYVSEDTLLPP